MVIVNKPCKHIVMYRHSNLTLYNRIMFLVIVYV